MVLAVRRRRAAGAHRDDARRRAAGGRRRHHPQPARDLLRQHGAANVAVVVLDNATGEWLAWEGSGDYFDADHGGAINGPMMPRQPGSALKPFTYALAFEQGYTPATVLPDVPSHFPTAEAGVVYTPAQLRRPVSRSAAGARRAGRLGERAGGGAGVGGRRARAAALPAPRRLHDVRQDRRVLRPRPHARQRRGAPRRAGRRLRRASRAAASGIAPTLPPRDRERALADPRAAGVAAHRVLDHRHPRRRRGARVHLRPRRQPRVPVPRRGEDGHVAGVSRQLDGRLHARTSPSASGSAISIARRCATPAASPAPGRSSTP